MSSVVKRAALYALRRMRRRDPTALYWWRPQRFQNAGDEVGPFLFRAMTGMEPVHRQPSNRSWRTVVLSAGSILVFARQDSIIWGSGIMSRSHPLARPQEILAVRGPLSRQLLLERGYDCPEVYGDPAILLPLFVAGPTVRRGGVGFVPHYKDLPQTRRWFSHSDEIKLIDVTAPLPDVLREVAGCDAIVSSSLHGIIFAHAYGVPAARVQTMKDPGGDGVKYHDYYQSVELEHQVGEGHTAVSVASAAALARAPDQRILRRLQRGLLETCPFPANPERLAEPYPGITAILRCTD